MTHQEWIEVQRDRLLLEAGRIPSSWDRVAELVVSCSLILAFCCLGVFITVNVAGHAIPHISDGKACWLAPGYVWPADGFDFRYMCVATSETPQP